MGITHQSPLLTNNQWNIGNGINLESIQNNSNIVVFMGRKKKNDVVANDDVNKQELEDFPINIKRDIVDIINDTPSLVKLGDNEYTIKDMRYYSVFRICRLTLAMRDADKDIDTDNKVLMALCTDFDAMCEIMAIVLCNHLFTPDGDNPTWDDARTKNDYYISVMKAKVMNSTFEINQWAAIVLGAIKSIDLSAFFLLKKSVSTLSDSLLMRKKKSVETASQFMEAQSLRMQQTS